MVVADDQQRAAGNDGPAEQADELLERQVGVDVLAHHQVVALRRRPAGQVGHRPAIRPLTSGPYCPASVSACCRAVGDTSTAVTCQPWPASQ